jgi:hypothetical protein
MAWNITIHEHVLTGTDQEFYFALQGIDMYAGKWNAAYYDMLKNIYSSKSGCDLFLISNLFLYS